MGIARHLLSFLSMSQKVSKEILKTPSPATVSMHHDLNRPLSVPLYYASHFDFEPEPMNSQGRQADNGRRHLLNPSLEETSLSSSAIQDLLKWTILALLDAEMFSTIMILDISQVK
jgi:hypothetical protein